MTAACGRLPLESAGFVRADYGLGVTLLAGRASYAVRACAEMNAIGWSLIAAVSARTSWRGCLRWAAPWWPSSTSSRS